MLLANGKYKNWLSHEESEEIKTKLMDKFGFEITNKERAKIEMYEIMNDKPESYFCYLTKTKSGRIIISNWTGKFIAKAFIIKKWRDNFGGERISFNTSKAINGLRYYGTGFCGFGGYARIKAYKHN